MLEKKETFRKAALERLSSPERLDEMMKVTSPKGWIALITCAALITGGIVWSIWGRIPERVVGQGILIPGGSLIPIEVNTTGVIKEILVEKDQEISENTPLAIISQDARQREVDALDRQLEDRRQRDAQITEQEAGQIEIELAAIAADREAANADYRAKQSSLQTAQMAYQRSNDLFKQGATSRAAVEQAYNAYVSARSAAEASYESLKTFVARENQVTVPINQARNARQREIADIEAEIVKLTTEMEASETVYSSYGGRITDILMSPGTSITSPSDIIVRLERLDEELKVLLYVSSADGKKVSEGDEVHVSPSTVKKEEHGSIVGIVVGKSTQPATPTGMLNDLGNERLVEEYSRGGAPHRVEVDLEQAEDQAASFSGYQWTSGSGPAIAIFSGTPVQATIIVGKKRPIDYVIPIFRSLGIN